MTLSNVILLLLFIHGINAFRDGCIDNNCESMPQQPLSTPTIIISPEETKPVRKPSKDAAFRIKQLHKDKDNSPPATHSSSPQQSQPKPTSKPLNVKQRKRRVSWAANIKPNTEPAAPYHEYTFKSECGDILNVLPLIPGIDQDKIRENCQERFIQLSGRHQINQILINQNPTDIYGHGEDYNRENHSKSHLIVLDLDETIMDQRSYKIPLTEMQSKHNLGDIGDPNYWKNINAKSLTVSFNNYQARYNRPNTVLRTYGNMHVRVSLPYDVSIGVFRKDFMNFIAYTQTQEDATFDIMLYSMAISPLLIYQAVTMEMYYNFVYVPRKGLTKPFEFKYVIARAEDKRFWGHKWPKNLEYLMRMVGHDGGILQRYKNIVILDDMKNNVWSDYIPPAMIENKVNIVCYAPLPFLFAKRGDSLEFSNSELVRIQERRSMDRTFTEFMLHLRELEEVLNETKLTWTTWDANQQVPASKASTDSYMS